VGIRFGTTADLGTTTKVYVGSVEVAAYFPLVDAAMTRRWPDVQALTVQVNNMPSDTLGVPQPVTVVVSGNASNANHHFTPNPGNIYYLSLSGNDTTGTANDITKPFRTLQKPVRTDPAIWPNIHAGDHVIVRGGNYSDLGYDTAWARFRDPQQMGSEALGVANTGWICFYPYGNEVVHYSTPTGGNKGGFQGPGSAFAGTTGEWIGIFNFVMDVPGGSARDAAPINMQYAQGHWKVANNKLGPWVAGSSVTLNAACITGAGNFVQILGNYVHDVEGTSEQQNHGLYAGSLTYGWEIAWNVWENCIGGSAIQFNDSDGIIGIGQTSFGTWEGFTNCKIHHNFIYVTAKYGINFADTGANTGDLSFQAWNNTIVGTGFPPLRCNTTSATSDCIYAYNTVYDCCRTFTGSGNGYVRNEGIQTSPNHSVKSYNNIFAFGPNTVAGAQWFADASGQSSGYSWGRNVYFANGQSPTNVSDSLAIYGDPKFVDPSTLNFALQSTSPAINAGTKPLPAGFTVTDDFTGAASRLQGGAADCGSMEYGDGSPFPTSNPSSSGGATVGVSNSCTTGTWGNSPTSYGRRAYIGGVAVGSLITGTGSATYTPVADDSHKQFDWVVSVSNGINTTNYTVHVGIVASAAGAPVSTTPPAITGTAQAGVTVNGSDGTWTGATGGFAYQWFNDATPISGATFNTYAIQNSDVGHKLQFRVEALDTVHGSTYATSSQTATVTPASANPNIVQSVAGGTNAASNTTFTLPSDVVTGNLLVGFFAGWDQAPDNFIKSDNQSHTTSNFTNGDRANNVTHDNPHAQFFWIASTANGAYTLTVNGNGGQNASGVWTEVEGVDLANLFDIAQDSAYDTGTAIALTFSQPVTKPNDLVYVGVVCSTAGHTLTPGTGWTEVAHLDGTYNGTWLFKCKLSAIETPAFTATADSSTNWVAQSLVIKGS
jgi:hypothetical protein